MVAHAGVSFSTFRGCPLASQYGLFGKYRIIYGKGIGEGSVPDLVFGRRVWRGCGVSLVAPNCGWRRGLWSDLRIIWRVVGGLAAVPPSGHGGDLGATIKGYG